MTRETITLTKKEQQRAHVLSRVQAGALTARTAAELLTLSIRHVRRLLAVFRQHGLAALAHGNRGRVSPRRLAASIRARVLTLARTTYAGVNDHHLTELLAEREDLHLSRPLVRLLLRQAGLGSPRTRRPPRHRRRRERMPQAGLLIQMDGSHHPWLEDRGPRLVLHAAIDDATGEVLAGVFRPQEDAQGYFLLLRCLIRRYGVPTAAYTDRHGLFHRDPRTNAGYALAPAHPQPAGRPAPPDLDRICCSKYQRIVAKDNTVTLGPRHLQLLPGPNGRSYAGIQVNLYAQLNGTLTISYRGQRLRSKLLLPGQLPSQRPKERFRTGEPDPDTPLTVKRAPTTRQRLSPPPDHPWRLYADENR